MGNVRISNNIGYSSRSGATYIDFSTSKGQAAVRAASDAAPLKEPKDATIQTSAWALWGNNNLLPKEMACDIEKTGVLTGVLDGKTRFALGRGIVPCYTQINKDGTEEITEVVDDPEINDFLMNNDLFTQSFGWFRDLYGMGNAVARFGLTRNREKIELLKRDDVTEMRYQVMDDRAHINNIYLCANWNGRTDVNEDLINTVPLLQYPNWLADLKARQSGTEFAVTFRYPNWQRRYYSMPLWYAAYKWVKIAQGVPDMKKALFENNMRIKYMVIIYERYWDDAFGEEWQDMTDEEREEKRTEVFDQIDEWLVGSDNAYKSIFVDGHYDPINKVANQNIEIKPIEDNTKPGELLPDAAAANSEIAFSMMVNPAIFGGSLPSGPYTNSQGGSNIREGALLQIMMAEFERHQLRRLMNVVKGYNKWDKKVQFMIPAYVLTTLDTGGSTKSVVQ